MGKGHGRIDYCGTASEERDLELEATAGYEVRKRQGKIDHWRRGSRVSDIAGWVREWFIFRWRHYR